MGKVTAVSAYRFASISLEADHKLGTKLAVTLRGEHNETVPLVFARSRLCHSAWVTTLVVATIDTNDADTTPFHDTNGAACAHTRVSYPPQHRLHVDHKVKMHT